MPRENDIARLMLPVLEALEDAAILLSANLEVIAANARALADFPGLEEGTSVSQAFGQKLLLEALCSAAAGQRRVETRQVELYEPFRRRLNVRAVGLPDTEESTSRPRAILLLLRDISEEERLARTRMAFIASASHELRTPVSAILGLVETLRGPARDDAAARERFLEMMHAQARRMTRLIDDMLSLSRIEAMRHEPPSDTVDLVLALRTVVRDLADKAREAGVKIETVFEEDRALVRGDAGQLEQIFRNLLENAITYGGSGGRVRLRLRRRRTRRGLPYFAVSVRDWGPGIEKKHIPHLTERFYRVDKQTSRNRGGTGLGLAIVKHLVQRHRGRLRIESKPGKGALFTVRLPASQERDRRA